MAISPAPPVPELPIGALGPVPAPPTPQALGALPDAPLLSEPAPTTAPDLGLSPVPDLLPAPGATAPDTPVPDLPPGMRRTEEIQGAQADVETTLDRLAQLRAEERALAERFVAAQTPAERAELQEQAATLRDAQTVAQGLVGQAQQGVRERVAQASAARNVEMAETQEATIREQQAEAAKIRQQADVRARGREEALAKARTQMTTDRQAARALLERGPQSTGVALTLSSMFAEAVRAAKAREVPNFSQIFQQAWERDRQSFADEFDRAQGIVQLTGDQIADIAQQEREDAARQATAIAAIAEAAEQRMQLQAAQATTEEQRILATQILPMLRQERAQRDAEALAAREHAELKRRESEAGIAQKLAQARKTGAEAIIAQRKAARMGRGGGGAGRARPGILAANVVTYPDSDRPLVEFPDTPAGRKEAGVVRELIGAQTKALDRINNVIRLYEDADNRGLLESAGWDRSGEYAELDTQLAFLRTDLALVKSGGLATTEGDDQWAGTLVPDSPSAWSSRKKALAELAALRNTIEGETRSQVSSKTRLDKATRERIIGASRPKSVSRSDRAEVEKDQATQDLVSPKTSTARKLVAIDQVEAGAREEAEDLGNADDWLALSAARLSEALASPAVRNDPDARAAIREKLAKYEKFAEERVSESRRIASKTGALGIGQISAQIKAPEVQARATGVAERARTARLKDTIRAMSPAERQEWSIFPGAAEVIAEVDAEELLESEPEVEETPKPKPKRGR